MPSLASVLNEFHMGYPSARLDKRSNRNEPPGAGPETLALRCSGDAVPVLPWCRSERDDGASAVIDRTQCVAVPRGGRCGTASGDRIYRLGAAVWRPVRVGGPGPEPYPWRADTQRHFPGHHALPVRAVGAVRAMAVVRLAYFCPGLALPAPRLRRGWSGMSSSLLIRQDLVPMIVGYALIMGALALGLLLARRSARAAGGTQAAR